jgi:allantoin racemase
MKILHIVPITGDVLTEEMVNFISEPLEADTEVITLQIEHGPASIESAYDEALAAPHILELCKKAKELDCQGIFINCFGDPAVRAARELTDVPVFGGFVPGLLYALGLAGRISIITVLDNVRGMLHANTADVGALERIASVHVVDMPVLGLHDTEALVRALSEKSLYAAENDGASAILLGCTGMAGVAASIRAYLLEQGYDIPVIDPAQASLKMIESCVKLGLAPSKKTYLPIPEKERK